MNVKELLRECYLAGVRQATDKNELYGINDIGAFNRWLKNTKYRPYYAWVLQLAERHKHEKPQGGNDV